MIYLLNEQFEIDTERNSITDILSKKSQHLENRLMTVLQLLIEANGEIVKREQLIKEVWNDYPGGDEGINQAISHLRKYFEDDKKNLIKTIPKKGYILDAQIVNREEEETKTSDALKWEVNKMIMFFFLTALFVIAILIYQNIQPVNTQSLEEKEANNEKSLSRLDSIHQAETLNKNRNKSE